MQRALNNTYRRGKSLQHILLQSCLFNVFLLYSVCCFSYLIVVFLLFLSIFPQYPPVRSPLWAGCDDIAQTDSDMPTHTCILSLFLPPHTHTHTCKHGYFHNMLTKPLSASRLFCIVQLYTPASGIFNVCINAPLILLVLNSPQTTSL